MNLQHLEYFISVARTENFSASAKLLSVSQPALSKSISGLEETLGVPLFEKHGRNVKLTEYGKIFATYAAAAINEINAGIKDLEITLLKNARRLSFATPSGMNLFWEGKLVQDFSESEKDISVGIYHLNYDRMILAVKRDLVDYGICFEEGFPNDPEILKLHVGYYPLGALVSSKSKFAGNKTISFADLAEETIVTPDDGSQNHFRKFVMENTKNPEQKFERAPWGELFLKVKNDEGVYISSLNCTDCVTPFKSSLIPISDAAACRNMYLLCNKYKKTTPAMECFKNFLKATYRNKNKIQN